MSPFDPPPHRPAPKLPDGMTATANVHGGWIVHTAVGRKLGDANPYKAHDVHGRWYGKRRRQDAVPCDGEVQAVAHVAGCRPQDIRFEETR